MADTSWVNNNERIELYAKAFALGADTIILSSEIGARTFVETKERAIQPSPDSYEPVQKKQKTNDVELDWKIFWTALCEQIGTIYGNGILEFLVSPTEIWPLVGTKELLVRDCYKHELENFFLRRDEYIRNRDARARKSSSSADNALSVKEQVVDETLPIPNVLFIGTSGLGKSSYLQYLMTALVHEAKQDGKTIAIRFTENVAQRTKDYLLSSDGSIQLSFDEEVDYHLSDSVDISKFSNIKLATVLVSSAKDADSERYKKNGSKNIQYTTILTWSFEELMKIAPYDDNFRRECVLRYKLFGGSPRNFIRNTHCSSDLESFYFVKEAMELLFQNEKTSISPERWTNLYRYIQFTLGQIANMKQGEVSLNTLNSLTYHSDNGVECFWASKFMQYIGELIIEHKSKELDAIVTKMFGYGGLGCYFEYRGHKALLRDHSSYSVKGVSVGATDFKLDLSTVSLKQFHAVEDIESLEIGEYGLRFASNFPLIDAVIQPDKLLQFTVSECHQGAIDRLNDIRDQLHEKDRAKHKMIFVVPNVKKFKTQSNKLDIKQYVMSHVAAPK